MATRQDSSLENDDRRSMSYGRRTANPSRKLRRFESCTCHHEALSRNLGICYPQGYDQVAQGTDGAPDVCGLATTTGRGAVR